MVAGHGGGNRRCHRTLSLPTLNRTETRISLRQLQRGDAVSSDFELVYSLEIKVLDLEKKVTELEESIVGLTQQLHTVENETAHNVPDEITAKIHEGENPVRAVRQYRLMTQKDLSDLCGIRPNHISAIERGMSYGLKTAKRLADALDVPVDLLT
jgi:DNA-binding XRE family transcriptional regulator